MIQFPSIVNEVKIMNNNRPSLRIKIKFLNSLDLKKKKHWKIKEKIYI